jgi:hypothetical protein
MPECHFKIPSMGGCLNNFTNCYAAEKGKLLLWFATLFSKCHQWVPYISKLKNPKASI